MNRIFVKEIDGQWQRVAGTVDLMKMISVCEKRYYDGRVDLDIPCDPYPVSVTVNLTKVNQLMDEGSWTQKDLDNYDVKIASEFVVPDRKVKTGGERFEFTDGAVSQVFDVLDAPPPSSVSDYQFYMALATMKIITESEALDAVNGKIPAALDRIVSEMPTSDQFKARMTISGAVTIERDNPLTVQLGKAMGWSDKQIDDLFWMAGDMK